MNEKRIKRLSEEEDGAIGIGTLIVFIGLILVAAIASAVIVGVMGDLQETAKRTGQETQENVAPPVKVQHKEAEVVGGADEVDTVRIYITAIEGSSGYNLTNLFVMMDGEDGETGDGFSERYTTGGTGDTIDGDFTILQVTDPDAGQYLYPGEVAALNITEPYPMTPDTEVSFKFMSSEGATATTARTTTPSEYPNTGWFEML